MMLAFTYAEACENGKWKIDRCNVGNAVGTQELRCGKNQWFPTGPCKILSDPTICPKGMFFSDVAKRCVKPHLRPIPKRFRR